MNGWIDVREAIKRLKSAAVAAVLVLGAPGTAATAPPCDKSPCPSTWLRVGEAERQRIFAFAEDYKTFMTHARTELSTVREAEALARSGGFRPWKPGEALKPGGRYFHNNRDRALVLFVVGGAPLSAGLKLAVAHIDSPHLDLKARPLYRAEGFAMLQTSPHGGLLNYQWGSTPLALLGRVSLKSGENREISVGLDPADPIFVIAGLSTHVDADLRERKNRDVLLAEELDPIVGSLPASATEDALAQVQDYLWRRHGVRPDDLVSADLALVPAGSPRDTGFDRAMMTMYGQDDRFSAYAALRALLEIGAPRQTAMLFFADNEETGNLNNTGASSDYLVNLIGEIAAAEGRGVGAVELARVLAATKALNLDVNDGVNPTWPSAWETGNAPRLGLGVNIKVYGGGGNATSEYVAWLRRTLDDAGVPWQTATYKVGRASGGTLGRELARRNMDVVDLGAPVLSLHNAYETSSKIDLWWLNRAVGSFYAAD